MRRLELRSAAAAAALLLSASGCASVCATALDPKPYSGLQVDVAFTAGTSSSRPYLALVPLDMPGSFVVDTLLLPYTLIRSAGKSATWRGPWPK
jgi:uncharacterized protein YceK